MPIMTMNEVHDTMFSLHDDERTFDWPDEQHLECCKHEAILLPTVECVWALGWRSVALSNNSPSVGPLAQCVNTDKPEVQTLENDADHIAAEDLRETNDICIAHHIMHTWWGLPGLALHTTGANTSAAIRRNTKARSSLRHSASLW
jgi:hypothetical protein